jgi:hypothetical protein
MFRLALPSHGGPVPSRVHEKASFAQDSSCRSRSLTDGLAQEAFSGISVPGEWGERSS